MNKQHIKHVLHEFAQPDLDLWPAIQAQIAAADLAQRDRWSVLQSIRSRANPSRGKKHSFLAVCIVALLLGSGFTVTISSAQTTVSSILQRFGLVLVERTLPTLPTTDSSNSHGLTSTTKLIPLQKLSLAEAQQRVPFRIRLPALLPKALTLEGIHVGTGSYGCNTKKACEETKPSAKVIVTYRPLNHVSANLRLEITEGIDTEGGYAIPGSIAQGVLVNGRPATYARGVWEKLGGEHDVQWNDNADAGMLSWEQDGFTYLLSSYQLGLSSEELIRIAESLQH